jgi:hypothetical protein
MGAIRSRTAQAVPFDRREGRKSLEIRQRVPAGFPLDLIVRTPEFIAQRLAWGDCFTQEVLSKGQVLYEAAHEQNERGKTEPSPGSGRMI